MPGRAGLDPATAAWRLRRLEATLPTYAALGWLRAAPEGGYTEASVALLRRRLEATDPTTGKTLADPLSVRARR